MWWIGILISFLIAWWVASDARKRGYSQLAIMGWFFGVWLLLIIFLPLYLIVRPRLSGSAPVRQRVCPYCGRFYEGKVSFCPNCGADLRDSSG